ncbi:hypothetical protein C8024_13680 [Sphingopyxis sp. BSNA05]|uniref:MFS transporter n=1 Tax=Sphingopyxis sp. BSNA05 TaxID=1236614 RepID=UPI001E148018|nr:hypothetical protein [Sphingopyxis sp. BSNA05]
MHTSDDNIRRFNVWQLTCFGVLTAPLAMGGLAMAMYLPTYYAVDMGLGLGLVGAIFVLGRLLDIFTDPLIGHWSDETHSRYGPRKPWMVAGVLGFSIAVYLFLAPPDAVGPAYLLLASGLYFYSIRYWTFLIHRSDWKCHLMSMNAPCWRGRKRYSRWSGPYSLQRCLSFLDIPSAKH